jgi:DNA gyrase subunit A
MVNDFPASSGYGEPVQKSLKFADGEKIIACFPSSQLHNGSRLVLCSANGIGYLLTVNDIENLKRSGRRVMKVRDSDAVVAATIVKLDCKEVALVTKAGYGLKIALKDVLPREAPAVGVQLIAVKDQDSVCSVLALGSKCDLEVSTAQGKLKNISSKDIASGSRASRGNKILAKDQIVQVKIIESANKSKQLSL